MRVTRSCLEQLERAVAAMSAEPSTRELLLELRLEVGRLWHREGVIDDASISRLRGQQDELERRRAERAAGESIEQLTAARALELLREVAEALADEVEVTPQAAPLDVEPTSVLRNNPRRGQPNRQGPAEPLPAEFCGDCSPVANQKYSKLHELGRCDCWCHRALV